MKRQVFTILFIGAIVSLGFSSNVVKMADSINYPGATTFAPVPSADGHVLYFTSNRPDGLGGQDIWATHLINGQWTEPINLPKPLNTIGNEGVDQLVYDRNNVYVYLTLCNRPEGKGMCDIYLSVYNPDGNWTEPKSIGAPVNTEASEANAFFDVREDILYFTSNRPGGMGEATTRGQLSDDFWYSKRLPDGQWAEPKNLGAPINTAEWEEKIYVDSATGWIFFSSEGHGGKGGLDIYKVKRLGPDQFSEVVPLDVVNSEKNDSYFTLSDNYNYGFFDSDVSGKNQIYMVPLEEIFTPEELALRSQNFTRNLPPEVPAVGDMAVAFRDRGRQPPVVVAAAPAVPGTPATCPPCPVCPASVAQPGMGGVIYFEMGKAILSPDAIQLVASWSKYLKENPARKLEVGGHADSVGSEDSNLILSKRRADAVGAELARGGGKWSQILPAYFGQSRPAESNDPKYGNAKNRRVEIKVVE